MVTGSKELIRDLNTKLVLQTIIENEPISRASVSSTLGLTKATVSSIVNDLMEKGLVIEIGSDDTKRGRKPILLTLNKTCGYTITVDISTEYITLFAANLKGEDCLLKRYDNNTDRESVIGVIIALIAEMEKRLPKSKYGLVGICIGIHGVVHNNIPVFVPYAPYQELDFSARLEEYFRIPIIVENEANLSALGEWAYSFHTKNMISVSIHDGIGVGIIMNNKLIKGENGYAGEFGHTIISVDGRPCPCGNKGCLEQYGSERVLLEEISRIKDYSITPDDYAALLQKKDGDAIKTMQDFEKYTIIAVSNLLTVFNPEIIVINSSFTMNFPSEINRIEKGIKNKMAPYCNLAASKLQDTAILLGGTYLCSRSFLHIDI